MASIFSRAFSTTCLLLSCSLIWPIFSPCALARMSISRKARIPAPAIASQLRYFFRGDSRSANIGAYFVGDQVDECSGKERGERHLHILTDRQPSEVREDRHGAGHNERGKSFVEFREHRRPPSIYPIG